MRILVRASQLWDGFKLLRDVDLTIEDGVVYFGKKAGSYDKVFETHTVLPGFIDTHVHLVYDTRPGFFRRSVSNVAKLFIAHGVLSVRDTGNFMGVDELFDSINEDLEIVTTFTVEKPPLTWMFMRMVRGTQDLDRSINAAKAEGCKWFKLYNNVDPALAKEALVKAHNAGLKVTCHLTGIGLRNVIDYGFDAFEHLVSLPILEPVSKKPTKDILIEAWEKIDEGVIEELAVKMSKKGLAVTTTLGLLRSATGKLRVDKRKYSKYVSGWYRFYKGKKVKEFEKIYVKTLKAVKILMDKGVRVLAGTDLPNNALNPGISLWEEIDILQEAGLDFWSALKTATGYASETSNTNVGVIKEKGKANLLLINKDLKNVYDLKIDLVIIGNKQHTPSGLISELKKIPLFGF